MHKIVNDGITNFVRTVTKVDIDTLDDGYVVDSSPPPPPQCTSRYVFYTSSPNKWVCVL